MIDVSRFEDWHSQRVNRDRMTRWFHETDEGRMVFEFVYEVDLGDDRDWFGTQMAHAIDAWAVSPAGRFSALKHHLTRWCPTNLKQL